MIANEGSKPSTNPDAERVAIDAITFLADQPDALGRFMALSGIDPANLRQSAADPAFLGGILDFFLQDETLLLAFADQYRLDPADIAIARRSLSHPSSGRNES